MPRSTTLVSPCIKITVGKRKNCHLFTYESKKCTCGGTLYQRDDDRAETVAVRLREYHKKTAPLIDYYAQKGKLMTVNGDAPVDTVAEAIARELQA